VRRRDRRCTQRDHLALTERKTNTDSREPSNQTAARHAILKLAVTTLRRGYALVLACMATVGCTVDPNVDDKPCPCADGYTCEPWLNRCRLGSTQPGSVSVGELRVDWTTPNSIRWSWDVDGKAENLHRYELVVGRSFDEVATGNGATVWTPEQNPE